MAKIVPPKYVLQLLFTLQTRGYPAYLVGGCVRDLLLGVRPHDWDVCTGALPEQVMAMFPETRPTGLRHGTVLVLMGSHPVEVTTFRAEGGYADHRHPDNVRFVGDLTEDLSRRDFTVNAMALSADGLLSDPFGGREDLKARLIRCVGEPERRFEEDALRMLRALRFAARLGFSIEPATEAAIRKKAPLAAGLAAERVREELERLLLTDAPETVGSLIELGLLDSWLYARPNTVLEFVRLSALPRKAGDRWCGLCWLLEQHGCISSTSSFLQSLRMDGLTLRRVTAALEILSSPLPETAPDWKRLLARYGSEAAGCAGRCADAFFSRGKAAALRRVLRSGECWSLKELAVSGEDLLALGLGGRVLGEMLDFLLDYVIEHPENNKRELLLSIALGSED